MTPDAPGHARVLLVDDDEDDYVITRGLLKESATQYALEWAPSFDAGLEAVRRRAHDIYLIDYRLGARTGLELVREAHRHGVTAPFVMLTGTGGRDVDVAASAEGVDDYLVKGTLTSADLERAMRYALARARVRVLQGHAEALRESEARFRQLAEAMPQIVWTATADGALDYVNEQWTSFTGEPRERALGSAWEAALHPEDGEAIERWTAAIRTGAVFEAELRLRRASDGEYRWHLSRAVPVRDADGRVVKWFGTSTDIHDQKEALRVRDDFLSAAAHELRNPLNSLLLSIESLERLLKTNVERRVRERIEFSRRQVERLATLIRRLLDVSRITTGRLELEVESADLVQLVREAVERELGSGNTITLQAPPALRGAWDRLRVDQVVTNLLSNALKYGEGTPITVDVTSHGQEVALRVTDQGPGIAPEDRERIFQRFERATSLSNVGGLGLGLWIVSEIVRAMGGRVQVESEPGRGSTFEVILPWRRTDAPEVRDSAPRPSPAGPRGGPASG